MENSDQETAVAVSLASPKSPSVDAAALPAAIVESPEERRKTKQKFYKQLYLNLSERCEAVQQKVVSSLLKLPVFNHTARKNDEVLLKNHKICTRAVVPHRRSTDSYLLDNERLVHRIHQVAKQLRRSRVERRFIMDRLDKHRDNWREVELQIDLGTDFPLPEVNQQGTVETPNGKKNSNLKSSEKKDPNLPKRPANPFFRFCQEQRPIVLDQIITSGEGEPTKQDLTKRLAKTWNTMEHSDKKIYYDMYEKSKEKYAADMEEYTLNKSINAAQLSNLPPSSQ